MTDHPHQLRCGFFFNGSGDLFFLAFFLEINKFYLDKLMFFQGLINSFGYCKGESFLADKNQWFHAVDKPLQIFLLITFQFFHIYLRSWICPLNDSAAKIRNLFVSLRPALSIAHTSRPSLLHPRAPDFFPILIVIPKASELFSINLFDQRALQWFQWRQWFWLF
jgi:hypothetical protein